MYICNEQSEKGIQRIVLFKPPKRIEYSRTDSAKAVWGLCTGNIRTVLPERELHATHPVSTVRAYNTARVALCHKLTCEFDAVPLKIPADFTAEIKLSLKWVWKFK